MTADRIAARIERDALGDVAVPAEAYWGAQTQRSLEHFPFAAEERMPLAVIRALAMVKLAAARVNRRHGLSPDLSEAISRCAREVIDGQLDDQFPLAIWQTGSGTQSNMNVNEVIAGRANEMLAGKRGGKAPVHPNDHVNLHQSSNDSFPTALHIAAALTTRDRLLPALAALEARLGAMASEWAGLVKVGRTHLQDATPVTLGQEFSGYASQIGQCRSHVEQVLEREVMPIAQGATAVGTGINAPPDFAAEMARALADITSLPLRPAENPFAAIAAHEGLAALSGGLALLASALNKIAGDIRLLGSGPRSGLGELLLPANEPGSSIMPGKVNPTQCEMLTMVCAQVIGNHHAVLMGAMQGQLELNVFKPLIGAALLRSLDLLACAVDSFTRHCLVGMEADRQRIADLLDRSLMLVTALVPAIGYDKAAAIALLAQREGLTLRQAALKLGHIDEATFDRLVRPDTMV